jgi:O-methyltransferase
MIERLPPSLRRMVSKFLNIKTMTPTSMPPDMEKQFQVIYYECKDFTMTSIERMYALYKATQYIVDNKVPGDIVECGVWKGGSSMLCALTMKTMGEMQRKIYLYDTYSGMSQPTQKDVSYIGNRALDRWIKAEKNGIYDWDVATLEEVQKNMFSTGYTKENLLFIQGKVEDTIPAIVPENIALLHLDTDWYESTYHELNHLFPRLSSGGVIVIDDYGHWKGAQEAVDKFLQENNVKILLNRIDYTGRIGIKQDF